MAFIILALIIVNIQTVYKFIFKIIFTDKDDFNESFRFTFTPNFISLFRGEYWNDKVGEFKVAFFIILCVLVTIIEYKIIDSLLQMVMGGL